MEQRIIELEIKVAYQEDLIQSLNAIVIEQQNQIRRLEQSCQVLSDGIKRLVQTLPNDTGSYYSVEIPPHY